MQTQPLTIQHPQDALIVIDALLEWASHGPQTPRKSRAFDLVELLMSNADLPDETGVDQVDFNWSGPK
jgi:hypothetical protein